MPRVSGKTAGKIDDGNILFENCSSTGDISNYAGGISGARTGRFMDNSTRKRVLWMEYGNVKVCDVLLRRCDSFMSCSVHVFEVSSKTEWNDLRGIH